jgi:hypothetical protein
MSMYDDNAAKHEGWALFECDDGLLRLQRLDCPSDAIPELPMQPLFKSDDKAMEYVKTRAASGSENHIAALALHMTRVW